MPTTPADKAETLRRRRARARLTRATSKLQDFEYRLKALHADRSGTFRLFYAVPLIPDEFYLINRATLRNLREALAGCPEASAWVADTAEMRANIDNLRATPLPQRDPTYTGPDPWPGAATRAGKRPTHRTSYGRRPTAEVVAERMAKVLERQQRGRKLLDEFRAEMSEGATTDV